jgi:beta-glucanase (GH16 family)
MLGDSVRRGTPWPFCGEIDIMENTNGQPIGHGTLHYNLYPGITANTTIPDRGWHTWRVEIDRRSDIVEDQGIRWYIDGREFHHVLGSRINDPEAWSRLAHSPYFLILNMAVGGNWVSFNDMFFEIPIADWQIVAGQP